MKNANGQGSIFKLPGARRKPWTIRITMGWELQGDTLKQKYKYLGYYASRKEAYRAWVAFGNSLSNPDLIDTTFKEMYDIWSARKFEDMERTRNSSVAKNIATYKNAFLKLKKLHNTKLRDIRTIHMQDVFDENKNLSMASLTKYKIIIDGVMKMALQNDIINKNYADFVKLASDKEKRAKTPFNEEEINTLWDNISVEGIPSILIMIYTGLRISEMLLLKIENVFIEEKYFIGGIKTKAGIGRKIPMHSRIIPLIEELFDENNTYLVDGFKNADDYTTRIFYKIMANLNMKHTPHECRHTFATRMSKHKGYVLETKLIMGHSVPDMTLGIYTHVELAELLFAVNLLS